MRLFTHVGVPQALILASCELWEFYSPEAIYIRLLVYMHVLIYMHFSVLSRILKISGVLSLHSSLIFGALLQKCQPPHPPWTSRSSLPTQGDLQAPFEFFLTAWQHGSFLRERTWSSFESHLICFSSLRVQCLVNPFFQIVS